MCELPERYARQIVMPDIGMEGQQKLAGAKVLVVGTGGLGAPILAFLVAAGIGHVRFVDNDSVSVSNLNRQILHTTSKVGARKVASAMEYLSDLNPEVNLEPIDDRLTVENAAEIFEGMQYVIDASDNFEAKYLVNDTAVAMEIPCTVGGVIRWDGQLLSVDPHRSACYRCVFDAPPPPGSMSSPAEMGVMGVTPGVVGTIAAAEAIKYFLDFPTSDRLINRMFVVDLRSVNFSVITIKQNPTCQACGNPQDL
jgi:molybdopterin/thiamine biosynthesis adenylyltransferase